MDKRKISKSAYWCVVGRYNETDETGEEYEEILEQCATLLRAKELGRDYAPWFGDDWTILIRNSEALTGKEFLHEGK